MNRSISRAGFHFKITLVQREGVVSWPVMWYCKEEVIVVTTGERIRARRKELRIPTRVLAAAAHISVPTVYRYENGGIGKLPVSILQAFAEVLQTTPNYLMGWSEERSDELPFLKSRKFRHLRTSSQLSRQGRRTDEADVDTDAQTAEITYRCVGDGLSNARILDGDTVCIRLQPTVENGQIALVRLGGEQLLRRIYYGDNYVELRAENPAVPSVILRGQELDPSNYEVVGLAISFQSAVR